jgi:predicted DNA-binding transcriptional regulator YafY
MYSPTTRLLTLLELLQSHGPMSGPELARRLEVDGRTVRRYVVMLQDMGIPVEAERGPYGAYQLRPGYKLPPLLFSDEEAIALTLGLLVVREFGFPVAGAAIEGALAKTERVMPEKLLAQARGLREAITFNTSPPATQPQAQFVAQLSAAFQQRRRVRLAYRSFEGKDSERDFDPYGIVYNEGFWYAAGYCHLRRDLRTFRLDRISALAPGDQRFERPDGFDPLDFVLRSITAVPGPEPVEAVLHTTLDKARATLPAILGSLEETDEGIVFRRPGSQLQWTAHYLLSLECRVEVRRPAALRDMLRTLGERAIAMVREG